MARLLFAGFLLSVLGLGIAQPAAAQTVSFVQSAGNFAESTPYTVNIAPAAGNFLAVFVWQIEGAATPSVTDNLGNVYVQDCNLTYDQGFGAERRLTVYHLLDVPGGITGIDITPDHPSRTIVAEYAGMPSGAVLDVCGAVANNSATTTSWSSPATTTTGNDLIFALADTGSSGDAGYSAGPGWNGRAAQHDPIDIDDAFFADRINEVAGTYTATGTTAVPVRESAVVVAYKISPSPAAPTFTSSSGATFTVGLAGDFTVTATGFPAPTLSQTGTLPAGVSFDAETGVLSGTPVAGTSGAYPITFTAQNGVAPDATQNFTLAVNDVPVITSGSSTTFTAGSAGSFTVTTAGFPAPTLSQSGVLPGGVSFNAATGVLGGTPAAGTGGTYSITFTAQNGVAPEATQSFTLTVNEAPSITSGSGTTFTAGSAGSFTVTGAGFPTPSLSQSGTLPAGVTFNAATGVLSGTPATATNGTYPITFTAQNGVTPDATQSFTLTVGLIPPVSFIQSSGNFAESTPYTVSIAPAAGNFLAVFVWQTEDASTPPVTDNQGNVYTLDCDLTYNQGFGTNRRLTVYHLLNAPGGITGIDISPNRPSRAIVAEYAGMPSEAVLDACGTVANQITETTSWSSDALTTTGNDLVFGLADTGSSSAAGYSAGSGWTGRASQNDPVDTDEAYFADQLNAVAGNYTATGTTAVPARQSTVVVAYRISPSLVPPVITSGNSTTFTAGAAGSFTATTTGYPAPLLSQSGTLPAGVSFNAATGVLSGTPAAGIGGTYPITFTAQNGVAPNAVQSFTLTLNEAPVITSGNGMTFTVGVADSFTVTATGFPAPSLSQSGTLPAGVTFNAATGVLSGTPGVGADGTYPITFTAQNGVTPDATQGFTLTVNPGGLSTLVLNPDTVVGGSGSTGTAILSAPAPAGGAVVTLSSDHPSVSGIEGVYSPAGLPGSTSTDWVALDEPYAFLSSGAVVPVTGEPGLNMTVTTATGLPMQLLANCAAGESCGWWGNFAPDASLLWMNGTYTTETGWWAPNGPLTVAFSSPQRGVGMQIMADESGAFVATLCAYDSSDTLLGCVPFDGNASGAADNSAIFAGLYDDVQEIAKVTIDNNGPLYPHDFAIGNIFVTGARRQMIPVSVTVPAGATSADFPISTSAVATATAVHITGTYLSTRTATLTINPAILSTITLDPATVPGGTSLTGTATLTGPAGVGGAVVTLLADNAVSTGVQVVKGTTGMPQDGSLDWTTLGPSFTFIPSGTVAPIAGVPDLTATVTTANGLSPMILTNCPAIADCGWAGNFAPAAPLLWVGGTYNGATGEWTANGPMTVALNAPQRGLGFSIMADELGPFTGTVCAYDSGDTLLGCVPFSGDGFPLAGGSNGVAAYVGVYDDAQQIEKIIIDAGGALYPHDFAIGELFVATSRRMVPPSVKVQSGATTAIFPVNTDTVSAATTVTITGDYQATRTATLTIDPPSLSSLSVSPGSVFSGDSSTGTVTLGSPAQAGGTVVALSSDNAAAIVPTSVTVPAAMTSATFSISTANVPATTTATITATGTGVTKTATLTVNQLTMITSVNSATFTVGAAGSFTVTATGTPAPVLTQTGTLPAGASFNAATGVLSGTPAAGAGGIYPIAFIAQNGVAPDVTQNFILTVNEAPVITSTNSTAFMAGVAGGFTVTATGFPAPVLSQSGALPAGVSFNAATGVLSGTATAGGMYPLTFAAQNGIGTNATQSFTLTVNEVPAITSTSSTTFLVGVAESFTVTASGFPVPVLSESGALPDGVSFDAATGVLSGTPTAGGVYPLMFTAQNGVGVDAMQSFTLTANQAPAITSTSSTTFLVGVAKSFTVTAAGFPAPVLSQSGALPDGVSFDAAAGVLSGTPTAGGTYPLTFTAQNGVGADATQSFTLTVNQVPTITSSNSATFAVGTADTFTVTATGAPVPTLSQTGALPAGVSFNPATGVLSGTAAEGAGGVYPLTFTAQNGVGADATQVFTLTVNETPSISSKNYTTFRVGTTSSFTVTATGFPVPTISATGSLGGITFDPVTHVLSGSPEPGSGGLQYFTFTAQNGVAVSDTQIFTMFVNESAEITSADSAIFLAGTAGSFTVTATGFPTPTVSQDGALPAGLTFDPATGILGGTPAADTGGTYPLTFRAHNGVGGDSLQSYVLIVNQVPVITSANSATFTIGAAGSFAPAVTGFPMPSVSQTGALPAGVSFNAATGVLSGTPPVGTGGDYPITFTAQNGVGPDAVQSFTLTVSQAAIITSSHSATFTVGSASTFLVTVAGAPVPTLSQTGALPAGVSFNAATGALSGTPLAGTGGNYPITFTAQNGVGADAVQTFTLTVNQLPAITSNKYTTFRVGLAGTFTVTATGFPLPTISATESSLAGVAFDPVTHVLSGTPAPGTGGLHYFTFTAENDVTVSDTQIFTVFVNESAEITSESSALFSVGTPGSFTVSATGFPAPTLSEIGMLPTGFTFDPATGVLSGTPAAGTGGSYPITFKAHNGVGGDAVQSFTVVVGVAPVITSANTATFGVGALSSFTVTASGSPEPTLSETGTLPTGVAFDASTGKLSGTPAVGSAGDYPITFTAHNGAGSDGVQNFTLVVADGTVAPSINSANSASFLMGAAGSFTVTATGSPTPTLSETGTLPIGITFDPASGLLSGTPAAGTAGSYAISFTAENIAGTVTQGFTLAVNALPAITTQPVSLTINSGQTATFTVAATGSTPLEFQWQRNGVNIGGANSSTYTTPPTTGADSGAQYSVVVSNALGSAFSDSAMLTVKSAPIITGDPHSEVVAAGQKATFGVFVNATGLPLTYQWLRDDVDIPGATFPTYTTPPVSSADDGAQIRVRVTNDLGSTLSNPGTITVIPLPSPATYYVDAVLGDDTNSGLFKDNAWLHAPGMSQCDDNCAWATLQPGDKVIFKGGVMWDHTSFPMTTSASGTSGNPIYYGVDQTWFAGSVWSQPIFDLGAVTWFRAPILVSNASFVTLDNLEIRNEVIDYATWPPLSSIAVEGGSDVTIENVYIHGWSITNPTGGSDYLPSGGVAFYDGSAAGVIKDSILDGGPTGSSGVGIWGGSSVQRNVVQNVPNGIVVTDADASVSGNQVSHITYSADPLMYSVAILEYASGSISNNIVHDLVPGAFGLYLKSNLAATTQYVYNNLVWNAGDQAPITVASDAFEPSNQYIYNNTLVGGASAGCVTVLPGYFPPTNLTVLNNHCVSDVPSSQAWCWNNADGNFNCGPVINLLLGNNILMPSSTASTQGYAIANSFQPAAPAGSTVGAGLNLMSDCVATGASLCSDRLGLLRPGGSEAWDAGAYQYQSAAASLAPAITSQPSHQTVAAGQPATFAVIATGSAPLTYQWRKNGAAIAGATDSTYTTPVTTPGDGGELFTVVVSNTQGSVTSSPATLTVNAAAGQLVSDMTSVDFGVVPIGASGSATVSLTNTSNISIAFSGVSLSGAGFDASSVPSGIVLAPGQSASLILTFTPFSAGAVAGSVVINSNAAGSPMTISLSGTGIVPLHSASLTWLSSASPVFGYYVYRATSPSQDYVRLNSTPTTVTSYTDVTVQPGQTYLYRVTAVDPYTIQSSFSDFVSATIPAQ